jgi:hypothetical protein
MQGTLEIIRTGKSLIAEQSLLWAKAGRTSEII